jgi:tRNA threonylcarbamoyladenosine biosynthesis protein TsaB
MSRILAIETASDACSVALGDNQNIWVRDAEEPRQHADLVLGFVREVLSDAGLRVHDLDALAFGCGPGSFTGVRIATAVVQGLALGCELPVVPVSTLAALAHGAHRQFGGQHFAVALDARMSEVYFGAYTVAAVGNAKAFSDECVRPMAAIELAGSVASYTAVGSGWAEYLDQVPASASAIIAQTYAELLPHARDVLALASVAFARGEVVSAQAAQPVYLRNRVTR